MICCTGYCAAEAQFNHKVAERDLRRYRRRGADATTRLMLAELRRWPLEGRRLLDVGGGIGVISKELAGTGVASATIVEASPAYLEVARREVRSQYGTRPTQFIQGDFAVIADTLPDADMVTLDRVVCCYPDAEALLRQAAGRGAPTARVHLSPRPLACADPDCAGKPLAAADGQEFRAFVHMPDRMGAVLEGAGLVRDTRRETLIWTLDLYRRGRDV
jgi:magnesium-protoporphyrin O-methyltransferase